MSAPDAPGSLDLLAYSRRLGGAVTVVAALVVAIVVSHVVRTLAIQSFVELEVFRVDFLRELFPLPPDRGSPGSPLGATLDAMRRWVDRAGWTGVIYVGRLDAGPQWISGPASQVPASLISDLSWYTGPQLIEPSPSSATDRPARLLVCRIDLDRDLSRPEYLIVFRPAEDVDRRLRSLYLLVFSTITGTLGLLFTTLISVVARGEKLRRAALDRAEELRRSNAEAHAMLVQAAKMTALGELAAGIGHEVNNPIAMVTNAVDLLAEHPAARDAELRQGLADIREASDRIRKIVKNLSTFSAPQVVESAPLDLTPLIRRTIELARLSISSRDAIQLEDLLPPDLPLVLAEDGPVQQVFLNLINNARYAVLNAPARPGPPRIRIEACVVTEADHRFVRVSVTDNGPGISPEHLPRLFEPFFTTKPRWQGTGLGLWISHRVVAGHGGRIRFETPPEGGTRVIVDLPVVRGEASHV